MLHEGVDFTRRTYRARTEAPPDPPPRVLRAVSAALFAGKDVPERRWLVRDMIPMCSTTFVYADGATGKSLLSLQLGAATATQTDWIGQAIEEPGRTLVYSCEDNLEEMHRRLADITAGADAFDFDDLGNLHLLDMVGRDNVLATHNPKSGLMVPTGSWKQLREEAMECRPRLLVLDTLADAYGGNENDRSQARQFVGMLNGLARELDAAVVVLAHPSVAGMASGSGSSGSTGWNNSVRSRLYMTRLIDEDGNEPDPDARILTGKKANYSPRGLEIRLRWSEGRFTTEGAALGLSAPIGAMASARAERVFLDLLDAYTEEGRYVSSTPSANYAPAIFAKDPRSKEMTKRGLAAAMNYLFASGAIVNQESGSASRRRRHIVRQGRAE